MQRSQQRRGGFCSDRENQGGSDEPVSKFSLVPGATLGRRPESCRPHAQLLLQRRTPFQRRVGELVENLWPHQLHLLRRSKNLVDGGVQHGRARPSPRCRVRPALRGSAARTDRSVPPLVLAARSALLRPCRRSERGTRIHHYAFADPANRPGMPMNATSGSGTAPLRPWSSRATAPRTRSFSASHIGSRRARSSPACSRTKASLSAKGGSSIRSLIARGSGAVSATSGASTGGSTGSTAAGSSIARGASGSARSISTGLGRA